VILKDGKVSCSCCEEPGECCMYPAQALADGDYSVDDLPDDVTVNFISGSATYNKIDPPQEVPFLENVFAYFVREGYPGPSEPDSQGIYLNTDVDEGDPALWALYSEGQGGGGYSECLIEGDGNFTPGDDGVEDQFADTYTVTIIVGPGETDVYTVTRTTLCEWYNEPDQQGRGLFFGYNEIQGVFWEFADDTIYTKDGFANTPLGTYGGGQVTVS